MIPSRVAAARRGIVRRDDGGGLRRAADAGAVIRIIVRQVGPPARRLVIDRERVMAMMALNVAAELEALTEYWSPRVIGRVNDQYVKVAKVKGELAWHRHEEEDELFHVVRGRLRIQFEGGREIVLDEGGFAVVPKGVLHNPVAEEECWIVLIETVTTRHTGDVDTPFTRTIEQQLGR
ncbi:cupin domain-containing protein [Rhizosaccharibacter radicis]|uniref:Cupin domain-containing protein n=1 Tax=Rhizosaccharibacter radicis TaxID=2782605 RepID=A0ABT1VZU5_9PROT|nr:cupin domain-containing protein [Acetobacteraceae bacterium KSS12]